MTEEIKNEVVEDVEIVDSSEETFDIDGVNLKPLIIVGAVAVVAVAGIGTFIAKNRMKIKAAAREMKDEHDRKRQEKKEQKRKEDYVEVEAKVID